MAGSTIVVTYDGTDITGFCVFSMSNFQSMMSAVPGQFSVVCRDMEQELDFITGKELTLDVDGQRLYGGFVQQVNKGYFFPADDTGVVSEVPSRQWTLTGVDYNLLLDTLVLHNAANYTQNIPNVTGSPTDADIILDWFSEYFDIPAGFDFTDTSLILANKTFNTDGRFVWMTQGTTMRALLEQRLGKPYGSVYWIDANKKFNFLPVQETNAPWGFSDKPNNDPIGVGTPTYGFREGEFTEDASSIVNDALVWGGSEWALGGAIVFARRENATSIADHGRWQIGENQVGNENYKVQAEVTARAKIIVDGNASGTFAEGSQGLVNPARQFRCTWFSTDVPEVDDTPVHLLPSQIVPIRLYVFSEDAGVTPFAVDLPLREVSISFPDLDPGGDAYLQFDGSFGVLMDDPMWLWAFLRESQTRSPGTTVATTANNDTVDPPYGAQYQGTPSPDPDGIETTFAIPWGYISGTLTLYINGLLQGPGAFVSEDPAAGEFTLNFAPDAGDTLFVEATIIG